MCAWWAGQPGYGSNAVSKFVRENFAWLKTRSDLVDLIQSSATEIDNACHGAYAKNLHIHASKGSLVRARFDYASASSFTLGAAIYHIDGAENKQVYWDAPLTINTGAMTAGIWEYVYIDDSSIALGVSLLTNANILVSTTAPAYSGARCGWYNGNDRCIFAFNPTTANTVPRYAHDGGELVLYETPTTEVSIHAVPSAHTETFDVPTFCGKAKIMLFIRSVGAVSCKVYMGIANAVGSLIFYSSGAGDTFNLDVILTAANQATYWSDNYGTNHSIDIFTNGYYFPVGM